jgi:hypothetical protein
MASKIKVDTLETADGTGSITLNNPIEGVVTEDASGNVGIGVTPESWGGGWKGLQINTTGAISTSADNIGINENATNTSGWKYITTSHASQYYQTDGTHTFKVAPSGTAESAISWTTAMTINNSGAIGIGTSSNVAQLGVFFDGSVQNGSVYRLTTNAGSAGFMYFQDNASNTCGSVTRIGTTSAVLYATSSDYRLKEDWQPMSGSIDRLKELKPVNFAWKADGSRTNGFLAHEAQAIVPECVTGEKDGMMMEEYEVTPAVMDDDDNVITEAVMGERSVPDMQGIDQAKLVPLLTSALQDAIAKIEQLESRISALEVN